MDMQNAITCLLLLTGLFIFAAAVMDRTRIKEPVDTTLPRTTNVLLSLPDTNANVLAEVPAPLSRTNPPPGDVILCDNEGHYLPLVKGRHKFMFDPVVTSRQEALRRLWLVHDKPPEKDTSLNPDDFNWQECEK